MPGLAAPWIGFLLALLLALPAAARWITPWPINQILAHDLSPDDVLAQHGHYMQTAPFYAKRFLLVTGLGWHELNFGSTRRGSEGRFPSEEEFRDLWNGPKRVFVIVHEDDLRKFGDPGSGLKPGRLLAQMQNRKFSLLVNR